MSGKILIIEDEKRLRTNMDILLTDEGYRIVTAENGKEGLQYLAQEPFDLIINDIVMDDMNGFEVMEHIATHGLDTLVIVITGFASTASAIQALRQGAYDYLPKPFDMDIMKISIKRALEKVRLQRTLKSYMQELEQRVADRTLRRPYRDGGFRGGAAPVGTGVCRHGDGTLGDHLFHYQLRR